MDNLQGKLIDVLHEAAEEGYYRKVGDDYFSIDSRKHTGSILTAVREAMLTPETKQAVTNALGRMLRVDGPDPNGYERYKPGHYADTAITTILNVLGMEDE